MDLSFLPLTLEAVDRSTAEALCLFVGEDERPLTGLSGLADWRLAGGLSRLLRAGLLKGTEGEALLTPARRMPFSKLFLFGLGPLSRGEEDLSARIAEAIGKLAAAGVVDAALQLPQRLTPEVGIRTLVAIRSPSRAVVFGPDPGALVRALSQVASQGGGPAPERRVVKVPGPPKPPPIARPAAPPRVIAGPAIPKVAPLPFTPSNANLPRARLPEPPTRPAGGEGSASAQKPQSGSDSAAADGSPKLPATPAPADSTEPLNPAPPAGPLASPPASGATPPPGARPTPRPAVKPAAATEQPPPSAPTTPASDAAGRSGARPPLPKTQRYVPPEPRPCHKKKF